MLGFDARMQTLPLSAAQPWCDSTKSSNTGTGELSKFIMHLRQAFAVALAMAPCCMAWCSETNSPTHPNPFFRVAPVQLRVEQCPKQAQPEPSILERQVSPPSVETIAVEAVLSTDDLHSEVVRSDRFYLTQVKVSSDGGALGFLEEILKPEVLRLGKVSVSSPLLTAIKRKNPLCLINLTVLQVDW
jgi:hypothetical protein